MKTKQIQFNNVSPMRIATIGLILVGVVILYSNVYAREVIPAAPTPVDSSINKIILIDPTTNNPFPADTQFTQNQQIDIQLEASHVQHVPIPNSQNQPASNPANTICEVVKKPMNDDSPFVWQYEEIADSSTINDFEPMSLGGDAIELDPASADGVRAGYPNNYIFYNLLSPIRITLDSHSRIYAKCYNSEIYTEAYMANGNPGTLMTQLDQIPSLHLDVYTDQLPAVDFTVTVVPDDSSLPQITYNASNPIDSDGNFIPFNIPTNYFDGNGDAGLFIEWTADPGVSECQPSWQNERLPGFDPTRSSSGDVLLNIKGSTNLVIECSSVVGNNLSYSINPRVTASALGTPPTTPTGIIQADLNLCKDKEGVEDCSAEERGETLTIGKINPVTGETDQLPNGVLSDTDEINLALVPGLTSIDTIKVTASNNQSIFRDVCVPTANGSVCVPIPTQSFDCPAGNLGAGTCADPTGGQTQSEKGGDGKDDEKGVKDDGGGEIFQLQSTADRVLGYFKVSELMAQGPGNPIVIAANYQSQALPQCSFVRFDSNGRTTVNVPTEQSIQLEWDSNGDADGNLEGIGPQGWENDHGSARPAGQVIYTPSASIGQTEILRLRCVGEDGVARDASVIINIVENPSFSLSASPANVVIPGVSGPADSCVTIGVNPENNYTSPINLSLSYPAGSPINGALTAQFSPQTLQYSSSAPTSLIQRILTKILPNRVYAQIVQPGSYNTSRLCLSLNSRAPRGTFPVTIVGSGGGVSDSATINVTIRNLAGGTVNEQ